MMSNSHILSADIFVFCFFLLFWNENDPKGDFSIYFISKKKTMELWENVKHRKLLHCDKCFQSIHQCRYQNFDRIKNLSMLTTNHSQCSFSEKRNETKRPNLTKSYSQNRTKSFLISLLLWMMRTYKSYYIHKNRFSSNIDHSPKQVK